MASAGEALDVTVALREGRALYAQRRFDEAASAFASALEADPAAADAMLGLAMVRCAQGHIRLGLPLAQSACQVSPGNARAYAAAGAMLIASRQLHEGVTYLQRSLTLDRMQPDVLNNAGAALRALGRDAEALRHFQRALELQPHYLDARHNFASTLIACNRHDEAIVQYRLLADADPSGNVLGALGTALFRAQRAGEALLVLERALALDPADAGVRAALGNVLLELGQTQRAAAAFARAIELCPERAELYRFLSDASPAAISPAHVAALQTIVADPKSDDDAIDGHFALGAIYAGAGDRVASFEHYVEANRRKRRFVGYDEAATLDAFSRIATVFTGELLRSRKHCGDDARTPVFIVGMPRSGTTLIEQILARHPAVHAAGELDWFERAVNAALARDGEVSVEAFVGASPETLQRLGAAYAARLRDLAPQAARITDKMPANFRYLGLISIVLPHAKILHVKRDPANTCLSCFTHYFQEGQPFAYDLGELGRYYRAYARLMEHWHAVLEPGSILDVCYEAVVTDLETQARRIVEFCGLPWDDRCLEFYKAERPVRTASAAQVRRPIYSTSVRAADGYGDLLAPLLDELARLPD